MSIRMVVFDVDGTLVDSEFVITHCLRTAFSNSGLCEPSQLAVREIIGLSLPEAVGRLAPEVPANIRQNIAEKYKDIFLQVRAERDFKDRFFEGALACLKGLNESGYLLAVATGKSRRGLKDLLAQHDLNHFFVALGTADDGPGKPHPHMLEKVLSESGVSPSDAVMIGDTTFDMAMAKAAGVCAVGVSWGNHAVPELHKAGADHVVDTFSAFMDWVHTNFPIN